MENTKCISLVVVILCLLFQFTFSVHYSEDHACNTTIKTDEDCKQICSECVKPKSLFQDGSPPKQLEKLCQVSLKGCCCVPKLKPQIETNIEIAIVVGLLSMATLSVCLIFCILCCPSSRTEDQNQPQPRRRRLQRRDGHTAATLRVYLESRERSRLNNLHVSDPPPTAGFEDLDDDEVTRSNEANSNPLRQSVVDRSHLIMVTAPPEPLPSSGHHSHSHPDINANSSSPNISLDDLKASPPPSYNDVLNQIQGNPLYKGTNPFWK